MTLGEQIYNLRKQKGLTQEKAAELVGVSRQTIHKWENDVIQPNSDNITVLANVLGVKPIELLSLVYPVEKTSATEHSSIDKEDEVVSEVATTGTIKSKSKFSRYSVKIAIILGITLFIFILITIWMWFLIGTTQKGDMVASNYYIDSNVFIIMIIVSVSLLIGESILVALIIRDKRLKKASK